MKKFLFATVMSVIASAGVAHANTVSGSLWQVPEAIAQNATPANVPGAPADVTFDVNSPLNFNAGLLPTRNAWLLSGGAFNIVENTAGTLASPMDNGTTGTLLNFTGFVTVTSGQNITVTHDDGLTLIIGGLTVINQPGPTAPTTTMVAYGGPSGNLPFQLVYGECCQGAAVLQIDLPLSSAVPLPAALPLFASGLGAMGLFGWRRKRKKAVANAAA
jgi:hypothetical protein